MSLQVWLPLNGDVENKGLYSLPVESVNTITFDENGKIGKASSTGRLAWHLTEEILGNQWSVATWIKSTATFGANNNIIFCKNNTSSNDCQIYFSIVNGTVLNIGVNGPSSSLSVSNTFSLNVWYHVAATYDGNTVSLYINGELKKTGTVTTAMPTGRLNMNLNGRSTNSANTGATGQLDPGYCFNDFRLYDHCLTKKEVKEISKALTIHLKLDNSSFGSKNLIPDSVYVSSPWKTAIQEKLDLDGRAAMRVSPGTLYSNTSNGTTELFPGLTYEENTQYTFSIDWRDDYRTDGKQTSIYFRFEYSDGTFSNLISGDLREKHYWTHSKLTSTAGKTVVRMRTTYGNVGGIYLANLKLEKGTKDTGWAPYDEPEIYDCSGYNHPIIKSNLSFDSDSPKYSNCAVFSGSSYVKFSENTWLAQYAEEMTINLWAYASNWANVTNGGRLFSCTETGGFNVEGGATGYWRFPRYVATNAERTSHAYKYNNSGIKLSDLSSGWHMFTFLYKSTGEELYVDGESHSSWNNTSYGIKFNTSARLFLGCEASTANPGGNYFTGKESDFRLYYTALSAEDVLELYQITASADRNGDLYVREAVEV